VMETVALTETAAAPAETEAETETVTESDAATTSTPAVETVAATVTVTTTEGVNRRPPPPLPPQPQRTTTVSPARSGAGSPSHSSRPQSSWAGSSGGRESAPPRQSRRMRLLPRRTRPANDPGVGYVSTGVSARTLDGRVYGLYASVRLRSPRSRSGLRRQWLRPASFAPQWRRTVPALAKRMSDVSFDPACGERKPGSAARHGAHSMRSLGHRRLHIGHACARPTL
jgi:hypothetical protein